MRTIFMTALVAAGAITLVGCGGGKENIQVDPVISGPIVPVGPKKPEEVFAPDTMKQCPGGTRVDANAECQGLDLDKTGFSEKLREFARTARGAEATLFFYAGHGLQIGGENYLVPIDAKLAEEVDLRLETFELAAFMNQMRSGTRLVFLDACRDNPWVRSLAHSMGPSRFAAIGRGLGRVESAGRIMIAYATQPGNVAGDGEGRNSPFTGALLTRIATPGPSAHDHADFGDRLSSDRHGGRAATVDTILVAQTVLLQPAASSPSEVELLFWESINDSEDLADLRAYLTRFPGGTFEALAHNRLRRLEMSQGISANGNITPELKMTSKPAPTAPDPETVESSLGLKPFERRRIQMALVSLGFDPGPVDGLFGPRTREAIRGYQRQKGFAQTGYLTDEETDALVALGEKIKRVAEESSQAKMERVPDIVFPMSPDDRAFARAKNLNTVRAYEEYLSLGHRHEKEARRLLAEARAERERLARARAERKRRDRKQAEETRRLARKWPGGKKLRDCSGCPELVVVPAGIFMMGSPPGEPERYDSEGPVHRVAIGKPFAVGVYEVTVRGFGQFVEDTGHSTGDRCVAYKGGEWKEHTDRRWSNPGFPQTSDHPVTCVSWEDAQAYVSWLSRKTGEWYRLLSESEWEYTARAGTETSRYWGMGESGQCHHENGADMALKRRYIVRKGAEVLPASCDDGYAETAPVGSFRANAFGLHDVLGNVGEWVDDCPHGSYDGAPSDGSPWTIKGDCARRVVRGGAWLTGPIYMRSAFRGGFEDTGVRIANIGFRVARTLD